MRMSDEEFENMIAAQMDCPVMYAEARRARESEAAALDLLERLYTAEPEFEPWDEVYPMMIKAGRI